MAGKTWFLFKNFVKHLAIVAYVITMTLVFTWLFTGSWPPVVVVQSGSMMHDPAYSQIGAIDTGDIIFFRSVDESDVHDETSSWIDREDERYGAWGDVLIFNKNGEEETPLIHRAVVWLEVNLTNYDAAQYGGATYDIPSMGLFAQDGTVVIPRYPSFALNDSGTVDLIIRLDRILYVYHREHEEPRSGYITKGDNNPEIDQPDVSLPVEEGWIMGKAGGEVPWLGIVSLIYRDGPDPIPVNSWFWLIFTLVFLLTISITMEIMIKAFRKRRRARQKSVDKGGSQRSRRRYRGPGERDGGRERGKGHDANDYYDDEALESGWGEPEEGDETEGNEGWDYETADPRDDYEYDYDDETHDDGYDDGEDYEDEGEEEEEAEDAEQV